VTVIDGRPGAFDAATAEQSPRDKNDRDNGDGVDRQLSELAKRMEEHELAVWATSVDAVAALPGNPLDAVIDRSGPLPLFALCAVDRGDINRVIALGVDAPARSEDLEAICCFYEEHGQRNFRIEVTPFARPSELAGWITNRDLACEAAGTFKMWRRAEHPPAAASDIEVRRLGPSDADALTAVNVAAWGAWNMPVSMAAWFGATVGRDGVQHYGVFDADRLVATGALFVGDGLGWLGFDATHPRYQGRKLRQAISSFRMVDAAAQGCEIVHAESAVPPSHRALSDRWRLLYEKQNYLCVRVNEAVTTTSAVAGTRRQRVPDAPDHS
jgi:hypothetical protein